MSRVKTASTPAMKFIFDEIDRMVGRLSMGKRQNKVISLELLTTPSSGLTVLRNVDRLKSE